MASDITSVFEKKFTFHKVKWEIPAVSDWCVEDDWNINELAIMKSGLNQTKCLLNDKDIHSWRQHTSHTNRAGNVLNYVKQKIKPEFLTQAWCKFYEILESYAIFPVSEISTVRSLHLCEAPGAFIAALNHYVHSHFGDEVNWLWTANTLNPYYEENPCQSLIVDDRLLLPTLGKWIFGRDNTGNIMHSAFLSDVTRICQSEGKFHLVTADGSMDCQDLPEEQENMVSHLHVAEAVIALSALDIGGSLIIKMFTFYECASVCLLYLLNCLFVQVHIFKPATSKSGNSEVYVVCLQYLGADSEVQECLRTFAFENSVNRALFKVSDLPENFLQQLFACCAQFKNYQEDTIKTNIQTYNNMSQDAVDRLAVLRNACATLFIHKYNLHTIKRHQRLCHESQIARQSVSALQDNKGIRGSLDQRRQGKAKTWEAQVFAMEYNVNEFVGRINTKFSDLWVSAPRMALMNCNKQISTWIITGRPLLSIKSSKFCPILLITWWNELTKNSLLLKMNVKNGTRWPIESYRYLEGRVDNFDRIVFLSPTLGGEVKQQVVRSGGAFVNGTGEGITCYPSCEMMNAEVNGKQVLVNGCLHVLKIVRPGDTVVLRAMTLLTRFTVGILYLLSYFFGSIRILPSEDACGPSYWWLVEYNPDRTYGTEIRNHFEEIGLWLSKDENQESVLEVVPMQLLCEEPFYSFLYEQNTTYLSKSILDAIHQEKLYLKNCKHTGK